jgi:hypothetical protein
VKTESTERNKFFMNDLTNNSLDLWRLRSDNDNLDNNSYNERVLDEPTAGVSEGIIVFIDSYPDGADLFIDNNRVREFKTPGDYEFKELGKHKIEVRLPGKKKAAEITLEEGKEPEQVSIDFEN